MDDLTSVLSKLPEPVAPDTLTATVMARIAREADERKEAHATVTAGRRERPHWLWACAGVAIVFAVALAAWFSTGGPPNLTSARIGPGRPDLMPAEGPLSVLLGLGLLVYLAGLFAPLRDDSRR